MLTRHGKIAVLGQNLVVKGIEKLLDDVKQGRREVLTHFAVAALSERRKFLRIQIRRSETAATKGELSHYQTGLVGF